MASRNYSPALPYEALFEDYIVYLAEIQSQALDSTRA